MPYIQKWYGQTIVVKYGGNAMKSEELKEAVMSDIVLMQLVGINVVLVHGGGPEINEMLDRTGKESEFKNGLRVTDKETIDIVQQVLAGKVNKSLVQHLSQSGGRAIGLCGLDGKMLMAKKLEGKDDLGYVGEIDCVNPKVLHDLMESDYLPVVCPVGFDDEFRSYNINADDAACAIAKAVGAYKLVFLTDVEGVYRDFNDKSTFISRMSVLEADSLIRDGAIGGGMLPKLENCTDAVRAGVSRVHILDGRIPHSMLLEIFTDKGIGTMFYPDEDRDTL